MLAAPCRALSENDVVQKGLSGAHSRQHPWDGRFSVNMRPYTTTEDAHLIEPLPVFEFQVAEVPEAKLLEYTLPDTVAGPSGFPTGLVKSSSQSSHCKNVRLSMTIRKAATVSSEHFLPA